MGDYIWTHQCLQFNIKKHTNTHILAVAATDPQKLKEVEECRYVEDNKVIYHEEIAGLLLEERRMVRKNEATARCQWHSTPNICIFMLKKTQSLWSKTVTIVDV